MLGKYWHGVFSTKDREIAWPLSRLGAFSDPVSSRVCFRLQITLSVVMTDLLLKLLICFLRGAGV